MYVSNFQNRYNAITIVSVKCLLIRIISVNYVKVQNIALVIPYKFRFCTH